MPLFYQPEIAAGFLPDEESRHAVKVLRLKPGDKIEITDGRGNLYSATITEAEARKCTFKITATQAFPQRDFSIHLAIAPTKNSDRIEWMVEKCVEIGIDKISFVQGKTSERKSLSLDRLEKIIVSALKQSRQTWLPRLSELVPIENFIAQCEESQRFIAFVNDRNPIHLKDLAKPRGAYVVLVGPEGDFTKEELTLANDHAFHTVSLGPHRLRTETAGLTACCILNLINS